MSVVDTTRQLLWALILLGLVQYSFGSLVGRCVSLDMSRSAWVAFGIHFLKGRSSIAFSIIYLGESSCCQHSNTSLVML